ncbi:hypothetical protein [Pedobacter sp. UBA5917]|uniref:hypothetical protein n=1 Tax=Pedobacter sp. UBA5917 TaxID=1947061 RepID=UPI0025E22E7F|nr:hypothetical protein [Pedobacter sp. UBA5917]
MKQIEPYINFDEAIRSLDNGGRFYNLLTHAEDGIISQAEVGKIGGLFNEKQQTILFLELAISKLNASDKAELISKLDDKLQLNYQKYKAQELLPSEANSIGIISSNAIITGFPKMKESKSDFTGFILIPISTGKSMTFVTVPIIDQYDIYEIRDEESSETFLIAHAKDSIKLPEQKIKVAGVLKELKMKKDSIESSRKFLEINYFLNLD